MKIEIVVAKNRHVPWLIAQDQHVSEHWVRRCVSLDEYFVAELDEKLVGFLRFSWFWGTLPYMEMIQVLPDNRQSGIGRALFEQWEGKVCCALDDIQCK